ncbi:N/A [soil metagenome]
MGSTIGWVALGGALGATGRYLVSTFAVERWGVAFPYGTLFVNVAGSLLLGVVAGIFARGTGLPDSVRLLVGVGFCGAFTTFSTFAVETVGLAERPSLSSALLNLALNNVLCLLAAFAGLRLAGS